MARRPLENGPNLEAYHRSLSAELAALKDRVRHLVRHWPTDGEHKEVALRSVLRRHVPDTVHVGRGFVVTPEDSSPQIDVLLIDASTPALFRDGDLFIVTPDAVRAIVEVKSRLDGEAAIGDAISHLQLAASYCGNGMRQQTWAGLFVYEGDNTDLAHQNLLRALGRRARDENPAVHCVSAGQSTFVRWWPQSSHNQWRSYSLDGLAPAYFLGNLLHHLNGRGSWSARTTWFPLQMAGGKERFARFRIAPGQQEPDLTTEYRRMGGPGIGNVR
jgi:hypothetical protein